MVIATKRQIRSAANKAAHLKDVFRNLGYSRWDAGSNTKRRFVNILGEDVYNELSSGRRLRTPRSRWSKVPVNEKNSLKNSW